MSERYIRKNRNSCTIVKNSRTYAKVSSLEDAVFVRDLLIDCDWDLSEIPKIITKDDDYLVLSVLDGKIHVIARLDSEPSREEIDRLIKMHRRNPNNSRYGLNITKIFDTFIIKKQIFNDDYIFGYFARLDEAQFVRNFLMDNDWDVGRLGEIEFDEDANSYRVVCVIDDAAYVLGTFPTSDINLEEVYEEFLSKVSKHRYGLADYPHLDELKDKIPELEARFNVTPKDDVWSLDGDVTSPLSDIVFNLTSFQKSVYDAVSTDTSFDEIKKALIRYKSKNFEKKIARNLDELAEMNFIEKVGEDTYSRTG